MVLGTCQCGWWRLDEAGFPKDTRESCVGKTISLYLNSYFRLKAIDIVCKVSATGSFFFLSFIRSLLYSALVRQTQLYSVISVLCFQGGMLQFTQWIVLLAHLYRRLRRRTGGENKKKASTHREDWRSHFCSGNKVNNNVMFFVCKFNLI